MIKPTILIIAGGANSRFFPLNTLTHKGLMPLGGKPLLAYTLDNLRHHKFKNIVITMSDKDFHTHQLKSYTQGLNVRYVLQPEAQGMGDAVLVAKKYLTDRFAVIFPYHTTAGDLVTRLTNQETGVLSTKTKTPWLYGMLSLKNNQAVGIIEKPKQGTEPSNQKIVGIYLLNQTFLKLLAKEPPTEYNFESALDKLMKAASVSVIELPQSPPSLKYPWQLFDFTNNVFNNAPNQVIIEPSASVAKTARIIGPSYIGKNAVIGDFTLIRQSMIESGVKIGAHADIARSIFLPHSSFHGFGFIGDSIIGQEVKIGAGMITANKRFDRKNVNVQVKGKPVDGGRINFGTIIGAHTKIGVRTTTMPGKLIGADCTISPTTTVKENIPHETKL